MTSVLPTISKLRRATVPSIADVTVSRLLPVMVTGMLTPLAKLAGVIEANTTSALDPIPDFSTG